MISINSVFIIFISIKSISLSFNLYISFADLSITELNKEFYPKFLKSSPSPPMPADKSIKVFVLFCIFNR